MKPEEPTVAVELTAGEIATLIDAANSHHEFSLRRAEELYGDSKTRNPTHQTMVKLLPKLGEALRRAEEPR